MTIEPAALVPLTTMHRTHGNGDPSTSGSTSSSRCRRWPGEPRVCEPEKSGGLRWFALDALPDPVVPHERWVLDALRAGAVPPITTFGFAAPPP